MSLGARATTKGGGVKSGHNQQQAASKPNHLDKNRKGNEKGKGNHDKTKSKEASKQQATTEQMRLAGVLDRKGEDSEVRQMVKELMEMTCRSEEEVCSALHDADNDMVVACNILLEDAQRIQSEWQTSEKKKRKPPSAASSAPLGNGDQQGDSGPGGRGAGRGRRSNGPPRGGGGGRPPRRNMRMRGHGRPQHNADESRGGYGRDQPPSNTVPQSTFPITEDWDNEEWSVSLSETKVFTPSVQAQPTLPETNEIQDTNSWSNEQAGDSVTITSHSYHNSTHQQQSVQDNSWSSDMGNENTTHSYQNTSSMHHQQQPQQTASVNPPDSHTHNISHPPMGMSGTLTAAQTQYLSQLTQQSHLTQQPHQNVYAAYGGYNDQQRKQRARVPPPSKIPSTAVEMPDQEEIGLLDVQFGALEMESVVDNHQNSAPVSETASHETYASANTNIMSESLSTSNNVAPTEMHQQTPTTTVLESSLSTSMKSSLSASSTYPVYTKTQSSSSSNSGYAVPPQSTVQSYTNLYQPQVTQSTQQQSQVNQQSHAQQQSQQQTQQQTSVVSTPSMPAAATPAVNTTNITSPYAQYTQPLNSYQNSATAYGNVYTPAYAYAQHKMPKETLPPNNQYETSNSASTTAVSTNVTSLTSASTTQTAAAAKSATSASSVSNKSTVSNAQYTVPAPAFYTQQQGQAAVAGAPYPPYDEHIMRSAASMPHHMAGYYDMGYGREATFGLSGERFGRTDAASPQQVLPPGYAYFFQPPPPTTYQYGVYPQYGAAGVGGAVSGAGGAAAAAAANKYGATPAQYEPQPPPPPQQTEYKQQSYAAQGKPQGEYKQMSKVNSYEKNAAGFHNAVAAAPPQQMYTQSSLYIPHHMHHHQMDVRVNTSHRRENSTSGGQGGRGTSGSKSAPKPTGYSQSYWTHN